MDLLLIAGWVCMWFFCLFTSLGLLVNFLVFLSKVNGILDCTGRIVAIKLWQDAMPHYSVLVRYVWSILLGIVPLAFSQVMKDLEKLKPVGKLPRLGPGVT